jgi:rhodanese-related sulfurtransferase
MTDLKIISTAELKKKLDNNETFDFWNVLTNDYFKGEFIPGSIRVPLDVIGKTAKSLDVPKDKEIIVYCSGPSCPQSKSAQEKLRALGYTNVSTYEGGLEKWKDAGYEIESLEAAMA